MVAALYPNDQGMEDIVPRMKTPTLSPGLVDFTKNDAPLPPTKVVTIPDAFRQVLPRYSLSCVKGVSVTLRLDCDLTDRIIADVGIIGDPDSEKVYTSDALKAVAANAGVVGLNTPSRHQRVTTLVQGILG